jgi:hypothetical protein
MSFRLLLKKFILYICFSLSLWLFIYFQAFSARVETQLIIIIIDPIQFTSTRFDWLNLQLFFNRLKLCGFWRERLSGLS